MSRFRILSILCILGALCLFVATRYNSSEITERQEIAQRDVSALKTELSTGVPQEETRRVSGSLTHEHELALVDKLTQCVDTWSMGVNTTCMREKVFPALGITSRDVLWGEWYLNSDGRFFNLIVKHTSTSKKTTSIFEVTLYVERHDRGQITFEAHDGDHSGNISENGHLVSIYDLGRGDFLVDDKAGEVTNTISREDPSLSGLGIERLLRNGKSVGTILVERLNNLEHADQGGPAYSKEANERFKTFEEMGKENRPIKLRFRF